MKQLPNIRVYESIVSSFKYLLFFHSANIASMNYFVSSPYFISLWYASLSRKGNAKSIANLIRHARKDLTNLGRAVSITHGADLMFAFRTQIAACQHGLIAKWTSECTGARMILNAKQACSATSICSTTPVIFCGHEVVDVGRTFRVLLRIASRIQYVPLSPNSPVGLYPALVG